MLAAPALAAFGSAAVAGPPYDTDDPEPTELGHWEIYAFAAGARAHGNIDGTVGLDLNYGPIDDVQLTATLPVSLTHEAGGRTQAGPGDVELGVKYRFFHSEKAGFSVAAFPRVFVPTAGRRFGSGRVGLLLPVWAQKDFGPWSVFGGGGYTINPGAGNRNYWQTGLTVTRAIGDRLSLGVELTHESADAIDGHSATRLGFGGIRSLGGPFSLLVSAGPTFEHRTKPVQFHAYAALRLSF
ncbi:MAG: transporter [Allosphingosinicella sp.]